MSTPAGPGVGPLRPYDSREFAITTAREAERRFLLIQTEFHSAEREHLAKYRRASGVFRLPTPYSTDIQTDWLETSLLPPRITNQGNYTPRCSETAQVLTTAD